ncbi:hypothetical protein BS78_02G342000 [Paspalum vaginatum]|nr:hypothetical protein BS78_02G342000 [Paspalum vaginatum]
MPTGMRDGARELNRQMGCMAGIFQIFDRQRLITAAGRRGARHAHNRLPPPPPPPPPAPGNAPPKSSSNAPVQNSSTSKIVLEKTLSKCTTENSSLSMESSSASSSSSSCSSFSSLDGNKSVQQEIPYVNEFFVQRSLNSTPSLKESDTKSGPNVGFRDIVKGSINRDSGGLTVKTSVQEARRNGQYKDSPRPLLLSKSMDGTCIIGIDRSTKVPANVTESSRRLQEQSRFSCDDRRLLRPAENQESRRPSSRPKELPRLSLDSRKESLSPSSRQKNLSYKRTDDILLDTLRPQDSPSHRRASSVIAKLMGLEEATHATGVLIADNYEPARSPRPAQTTQHEQASRSPRSTCQDSCTSQLKTKPSPRILTEPAPWRQQDRSANNIKAQNFREAEGRPKTASIYADIERSLGGLDLLECNNKDIRALRILGALNGRDAKSKNDNKDGSVDNLRTGYDLITDSGNLQPPIVVMKPARTTGKPGVSLASVAPMAGLRSLRKLPATDSSFTGTNETGTNDKIHLRMSRAQSRPEETVGSSLSPRPTGSSSPRNVLKKAESERRSRPPVSPKSPSKKSNEVVSPKTRIRSKPSQVKCHRDEALQSTGNKICLAKQVDVSIMDCPKPSGVSSSFLRASNTAATASHKGPSTLGTDQNIHALDNIPSPVSVLDTSFYHKRISESFKDGETHSSEDCWNTNSLPDTPQSKASSEVNQIKPENLEVLIQKLEQLQSMNEEAAGIKEVMASITANKDHQYIYEILLASGLLHKEHSFTALPGQLQPSNYPINPELFLILEQTKPDFVSAFQTVNGTKKNSKPYTGKLHRRFVFDLVNETIAQKMNICRYGSQQLKYLQSRKLSGWQLFKDVCAEVDRLIKCSEEDENEDMLLDEDTVNGTKDWMSFDTVRHGMVLEIERSIFKDLIDEVIGGEAAEKMQFGQWKLRRQLSFSSIN